MSACAQLIIDPIAATSDTPSKPNRGNQQRVPPAADDEPTDQWIAAMAQGQERGLEMLYEATVDRVYGIAMRLTGNRALAEEVVADVYYQAWAQAERFDPAKCSGLGWLLMLCRSRALDGLRRERRHRHHGDPHVLDASDPDAGPDRWLEQSLGAGDLARRLDALTGPQKSVLSLAFFKEFSQQEIAQYLDMPLGTVKSHARRALQVLRAALSAAAEDAS